MCLFAMMVGCIALPILSAKHGMMQTTVIHGPRNGRICATVCRYHHFTACQVRATLPEDWWRERRTMLLFTMIMVCGIRFLVVTGWIITWIRWMMMVCLV